MIPKDLLSKFYLFRGAEAHDVALIARVAERHHCVAEEVVFHAGESADALYLIEIGSVEMFETEPEFTIVDNVGTGGGFGEISFFDRGKREVSVRAAEPSHLIRIPFGDLDRVLAERPSLAVVVYRNASRALAGHLRRTLRDLSFAREFTIEHCGVHVPPPPV